VALFASFADVGPNRRLSGKTLNLLQITVKNATLRQLKTFETVARRLSFSQAANELNLSPPAVSTQIKHLEEHAGVALFEQLGKKIYLTPAGREMLHHSRAIIHCFREAEETLAKLKNLAGGSLNVGVISTGGYFLPRLLAGFSSQNAAVELNLKRNLPVPRSRRTSLSSSPRRCIPRLASRISLLLSSAVNDSSCGKRVRTRGMRCRSASTLDWH